MVGVSSGLIHPTPMLTAKILQPTVIKQSTAPALKLDSEFKANLPAGEYPIAKWSQAEGNHFRVTFENPIASLGGRSFNTWMVWGDVLRLLRDGDPDFTQEQAKDGMDLDVPFFAQVAIKSEPTFKSQWEQNRTCFTSSMAMALKYLGAKIQGDDDYYSVVKRYGDTTSWDAQIQSANHLGFRCHQRTNADFEDVKQSIAKGKPAVIGILHRGTADRPSGGHMVLVRGVTQFGDFIVNDPYGSILDSYTGAVENGRRAIYPKSIMRKRWTVEGNGSGWMMLFG
jgi:hypothetical protein